MIPLTIILVRNPGIVHTGILGIFIFRGFVQVCERAPSDLVPCTILSKTIECLQMYHLQSGIVGASAAGIAPGGCATPSTPSWAALSMSSMVIVGMTLSAPAMGTSTNFPKHEHGQSGIWQYVQCRGDKYTFTSDGVLVRVYNALQLVPTFACRCSFLLWGCVRVESMYGRVSFLCVLAKNIVGLSGCRWAVRGQRRRHR